jgi:hypothetical protein
MSADHPKDHSTALARFFPRGRLFGLVRDQWLLILAAINLLFLGVETWLVHVMNGTIRTNEWIPILFGPVAGILLIFIGAIAQRYRKRAAALATLVFLACVVVGVLGAYFHGLRGLLPNLSLSQNLDLAVFAPPLLAPLAFVLVAVWGVSAAWEESPSNSGRLLLPWGNSIQLPYPKSNALYYLVAIGVLIALISSVFDHARAGFASRWFWLPVAVGLFALIVSIAMGFLEQPSLGEKQVFALGMVLLIIVGVVGSFLHLRLDVTDQFVFVLERFLRGAPPVAPMLFANFGLLGLVVLTKAD